LAETNKIPEKLYFKIGEVSDITGVKPYVLRYWESEFNIVKPSKSASNQRLYKRREVEMILEIKRLLYEEKFTIAGAKKVLQERTGLKQEEQLSLPLADKHSQETLQHLRKEILAIKKLVELQ
jgi:DNA-binding transcriptional MerR regulator